MRLSQLRLSCLSLNNMLFVSIHYIYVIVIVIAETISYYFIITLFLWFYVNFFQEFNKKSNHVGLTSIFKNPKPKSFIFLSLEIFLGIITRLCVILCYSYTVYELFYSI